MPSDGGGSGVRRQVTLTVLAKATDELALLDALGSFPATTFAHPALGIHFARVLIVPRDREGAPSSSWLALETNFDATGERDDDAERAAQLKALAESAGSALAAVFRYCESFPGEGGLARYLVEHLVAPTVAYEGHPHHDLARIRLEQRVREVVVGMLEQAPGDTPGNLFDRVRAHVRAQSRVDPLLSGLDVDAPPPALPDPMVRWLHLKEGELGWMLHLGRVLRLVWNVIDIVRWDRTDDFYDIRSRQEAWTAADLGRFAGIAATEDHGLQNALSNVVPLRQGTDRLHVVRVAHQIITDIAAKHFEFVGQLSGIPTIHFAKWVLIDQDRRLLFFSNYDSSWESYLGDFVDQAAKGLNLAWSCTRRYPRTKWLYQEGAHDEESFKAWSREIQMPTQVFYSAYPTLSIQTINNNTWIRYRLHAPASDGGLDQWFRRLS
jgi:hypothetical protein